MSERDSRPARKGESAIEQQIREAIERGEFDHLAGAGKPLDLSENPFTPAEWRMAYKMLQDAGMAPDWIEQDKELRRELDKLDGWLRQQAQGQNKKRVKMKTLALDKMISQREHLAQVREQTIVEYRQRAAALNKLIDTYNLKVPSADLHRERIRVEEEIQRFLDASRG